MAKDLGSLVLQIIRSEEPVSVVRIREVLKKQYWVDATIEKLNSVLYSNVNSALVRDKDENGYPVWRVQRGSFEAAKGLEVMLYDELLRKKIVSEEESFLGYEVHNRRNGKTYDLDIAVIKDTIKLDIEIDGFEHIRADARLSIQEQIEQKGEDAEIEIDWMDNRNSFTDFKLIDNKRLFRWFATHREWSKSYHEELLKPHDITRNIWLIENGWSIMRFWNFEIKEDKERCIEDVKSFLR